MGAVFGFSGAADQRLAQRMAAALAHRSRHGTALQAGRQATIGYCSGWEEPQRLRLGAGLHVEGDQAIAVSGYLTQPAGPPRLTELLERYRRQGPRFVEELRGGFVLVVQDGAQLLLARDGAGVRTVYFGRHAGRFYFAAEQKAILAAPGFPRRLRPEAVAEYLTFSFVPGRATMLQDLHELPPGHLLRWQPDAEPLLERFFVFEEGEREGESPNAACSEDDWVRRFRQQMAAAVAQRLPPDEPVGVFLSGGLDSSVVTAEVARQHDQPVRTYAIHFGDRYPHELDFARAVARRCGTEHEEVHVQPRDFLPRLREILWRLDDPIGDPITVPNFELSARVARDVRWVFNGEGGDPCFGGPKNIPMLLQHWYGGVERDAHFRERAYLASYRRCYDDLHRLLAPEWLRQFDLQGHLENLLRPYFAGPRPVRFLDKLAAINIRLKAAHLILPKVERMTAAWGLTALAPLFDEELIRFSFQMPARLRLAGGVEKRVLKRAYARDLPPEVIARPKSGMRVPVHFWFQREMRRYARQILSPRSVREAGILNPQRVQQLLDYGIEEGPGRYGLRLWMLITLEIWRRLVLEGESP